MPLEGEEKKERMKRRGIMKRRTLKSIACAAIMALALSATACGAKDAAKTEDKADRKSVV